MRLTFRLALAAALAVVLTAGPARADDLLGSLKPGTPDLKSAGPIAFAPEGILLIGDPQGAAVFAVDTGDRTPAGTGELKVQGVDEKVAGLLGTTAKEILINDLAVNPLSGNAYLSVARGRSADATPAIVRVSRGGKVEALALKDVKCAKANLPNPAAGRGRQDAITDLAYADGKVFVAGLSNEEFASRLRAIPFPFSDADKGTSVEIYHGAHGRFETQSPVRTFTPYLIEGQAHLLAAYTCTPLVKFKVADLKPGTHLKGTTVAELGNRNRPLDMIVYQKGGKDYVLLANSARGVMKITLDNVAKAEGITQKINDKAGLNYETIESLKNVQHLDKLDSEHALLLIRDDKGSLNLDTIALP
jgi:hypothetical protein